MKAPFNGPAAAAQTYAKNAPRCVIPRQYSCHASQKAGKSHFRKSSQTRTSSQKGTNCLGDVGFDTYNVIRYVRYQISRNLMKSDTVPTSIWNLARACWRWGTFLSHSHFYCYVLEFVTVWLLSHGSPKIRIIVR